MTRYYFFNVNDDVSIIFKRSGECFLGRDVNSSREFILVPVLSLREFCGDLDLNDSQILVN